MTSIRIQAENYQSAYDTTVGNRGSNGRRDTPFDVDITASTDVGGGSMVGWTESGEFLNYTVNVATPGTYDIVLRVASGDTDSLATMAFGGVLSNFAIGSTGGWNTWKDVRVSGVNLSAGVQNLRLDILGGRPLLNYIDVIPTGAAPAAPEPTPQPEITPPPAQAASRVEAEDYVAFVDSTSGNRGGKYRSDDVDITNMAGASNGYAVGWTQGGESLTYGFNIAAAGAYDIIVRLATDDANNGLSIGGKSISFGSTGGWNTLKDVRISGVNLSAGVQNLKLDVLAGRPILDYIEVVPAGTGGSGPSLPPGGGTPTPPSGVIKIMPLGDSNTAGRGDRGSYRSTLQNLLAQDGFNVDFVGSSTGGASAPDRDHEGHSGFTINNISAKINSYLSKKPDVILLMLGTNDVLRDNGSGKKGGKLIEPKGASGRLNTLINKITSKLPQTKVFVASIPPLTKTSADLNQVKAFNSKVAQLVKSKGSNVKFVDMYKALSPGDLLSDKIHLTQAGSAKAAKVWRNAIASTLGSFQSTQANSSIEADSVTNASSIVGTSANDSLVGDSGANIFNGLEGDDLLRGGGGKDTFILSLGKGTDTIADFSVGEDLLALSGGLSLDQLTIAQGTGQSSDDTLVFSGNEQLVSLTGVQSDAVTSSSFTRV
ncbi:MAG: carbohydrate-binding protein [Cyanobacteria bacterium J06560_5]